MCVSWICTAVPSVAEEAGRSPLMMMKTITPTPTYETGKKEMKGLDRTASFNFALLFPKNVV